MQIHLTLKELHPAQEHVRANAKRFTVLGCGRRFGKSDLGTDRVLEESLDGAFPYAYVVPTYDDLLTVWKNLMFIAGDYAKEYKRDRIIEFVTGSSLRFYSSEAIDRMRGNKFKGVIIDEAAKIPNLEYSWTRTIFPTLADLSGWAWFLSSFFGLNYFYQLYLIGLDSQNPLWASFCFPTSANPYILPSEIAIAKATLPEKAFREEYEAIPSADYGQVFRSISECLSPPPDPVRNVVFGVDWGKSNDYTVIVGIDTFSNKMVFMDRFNQISWELQRGRLATLAAKYRPSIILAESNSIGEPNIEALQSLGLPVEAFQTTNASKGNIIDGLSLAFEQHRIGILDDPVLIGELQAYEMERLAGGSWRYNAPSGGHDDCVMALALAWQAVQQGSSTLKVQRRVGPSRDNDRDRRYR